MGGSFGRAVIKNTPHAVFGCDVNPDAEKKARELKAINGILSEETARSLDLLVLAVTPRHVRGLLDKYAPALKRGAVVVDFCGVKRTVIKIMKEYSGKYPGITFIGGHPMAGRELSGIDNSRADLFDGASMIFVNVNADESVFGRVKEFFLSAGFGRAEVTTAEEHDAIIAYTSQLCHVTSNAYIKSPTAEKHLGFSAGSYRDLTRVARLDADMWAELMMENADYIKGELQTLINNLNEYLAAVSAGDVGRLKTLLKDGNDRKIGIDQKGDD